MHFQKHKPQGNNVASIKLRHFSKKNKAFPSFRPKPSPIAFVNHDMGIMGPENTSAV